MAEKPLQNNYDDLPIGTRGRHKESEDYQIHVVERPSLERWQKGSPRRDTAVFNQYQGIFVAEVGRPNHLMWFNNFPIDSFTWEVALYSCHDCGAEFEELHYLCVDCRAKQYG